MGMVHALPVARDLSLCRCSNRAHASHDTGQHALRVHIALIVFHIRFSSKMTGIPRSGLPRLLQQNCQIGHPETGLRNPVFSRFWPLNPRITCMALGNLHNTRGFTAAEAHH